MPTIITRTALAEHIPAAGPALQGPISPESQAIVAEAAAAFLDFYFTYGEVDPYEAYDSFDAPVTDEQYAAIFHAAPATTQGYLLEYGRELDLREDEVVEIVRDDMRSALCDMIRTAVEAAYDIDPVDDADALRL